MKEKIKSYYTPKTQIILYGLLLIFTPFLILQNFLQSAIGMASRFSFSIEKLEIPYVLAIAGIFFIFLIILVRREITPYRIIVSIVVISFIIIGQNSTDYYFNHKFYDLQQNWHYFAYAFFSYLAYRFFKYKEFPPEKIILFTFLSALALSTFDEGAQVFISGRIFDICDIAKDGWGTIAGIIFTFFILKKGEITSSGWKIRHARISSYLKHPVTVLFMEIVFGLIFLLISSILTNNSYWLLTIALTLVLFLIFFTILHLSQRFLFRTIFIIAAVIIIIVQGFFFFKYREKNIIYNTYGLTVYKGIPIPFFDIMIYPDETFRLVDKKHFFTNRDQIMINGLAKDILLIGSGSEGLGGRGYPEETKVQFIFNENTEQGLQIIILKTPKACEVFNKLRNEGKNVLFIIHNTC